MKRNRLPAAPPDAEWAVKCLSAPWEDFLREWDAQGIFRGGKGATVPC